MLTNSETEPLLKDGASTKVPRPQQTSLSVLRRWRELVPFLGVFGPLVVFWSIFYQQNSTWILQGEQMDCYLGRLHVPPGEGRGGEGWCVCVWYASVIAAFGEEMVYMHVCAFCLCKVTVICV